MGFIVLSAVLAVATIIGMVGFIWLTMLVMERLRPGFLERNESGILGAQSLLLGVGIIFFDSSRVAQRARAPCRRSVAR